jgi:hypothetical protein
MSLQPMKMKTKPSTELYSTTRSSIPSGLNTKKIRSVGLSRKSRNQSGVPGLTLKRYGRHEAAQLETEMKDGSEPAASSS